MLYLLALIAALMVVIERLWPGQALPTVKRWWLRLVLMAVGVGVTLHVTRLPSFQPSLRELDARE